MTSGVVPNGNACQSGIDDGPGTGLTPKLFGIDYLVSSDVFYQTVPTITHSSIVTMNTRDRTQENTTDVVDDTSEAVGTKTLVPRESASRIALYQISVLACRAAALDVLADSWNHKKLRKDHKTSECTGQDP